MDWALERMRKREAKRMQIQTIFALGMIPVERVMMQKTEGRTAGKSRWDRVHKYTSLSLVRSMESSATVTEKNVEQMGTDTGRWADVVGELLEAIF